MMEKNRNISAFGEIARSIVRGDDDLQVDEETVDFIEMIISVLLTEVSVFVIRNRFGLDGPAKLLRDIGDVLDVSVARVQQIEARALSILRNNASRAVSEFILATSETRQKMMSLNSTKSLFRWQNKHPLLNLEDLELSVGAYRALQKHGIVRFEDLPLPADKRDFVLNKMGKKRMSEVEYALDLYDLRLFSD